MNIKCPGGAALVIALTLGLVGARNVSAQEPPQQRGPMGDPAALVDVEMDALEQAVDLTAEQVVEIRPVYEEYMGQLSEMFEAARGQGRAAMVDLRPKLAAMRDEMHEQVRSHLSEDQIAPYDEFLERQQAQRRERMRRTPPSGS